MLSQPEQVHMVLPCGTKVLTRTEKRVGVVVYTPSSPDHAYRVRFPDSTEATYYRSELSTYRQEQDSVPEEVKKSELLPFVIYKCIVGSNAYGLATELSDVDRRGFYLPPAHLHWSLAGVPEQLETEHEEVYWEIEKFIRLDDALKESSLPEHPDYDAANEFLLRARRLAASEEYSIDRL